MTMRRNLWKTSKAGLLSKSHVHFSSTTAAIAVVVVLVMFLGTIAMIAVVRRNRREKGSATSRWRSFSVLNAIPWGRRLVACSSSIPMIFSRKEAVGWD
jgi:heme/copper-type cytochrome/quinol oxidase subunit 2